jgi:hypothetical protein
MDDEARRQQLREDGRRPLAVNLAEGLALSEFLSTFTGSARDDLTADPQRLRHLLEMERASDRRRDRGLDALKDIWTQVVPAPEAEETMDLIYAEIHALREEP